MRSNMAVAQLFTARLQVRTAVRVERPQFPPSVSPRKIEAGSMPQVSHPFQNVIRGPPTIKTPGSTRSLRDFGQTVRNLRAPLCRTLQIHEDGLCMLGGVALLASRCCPCHVRSGMSHKHLLFKSEAREKVLRGAAAPSRMPCVVSGPPNSRCRVDGKKIGGSTRSSATTA